MRKENTPNIKMMRILVSNKFILIVVNWRKFQKD